MNIRDAAKAAIENLPVFSKIEIPEGSTDSTDGILQSDEKEEETNTSFSTDKDFIWEYYEEEYSTKTHDLELPLDNAQDL